MDYRGLKDIRIADDQLYQVVATVGTRARDRLKTQDHRVGDTFTGRRTVVDLLATISNLRWGRGIEVVSKFK